MAEAAGSQSGAAIVVASPGWHPGVVGLVAARLVQRFRKPAVAIALGEDGLGRGSARSIPGIDLGAAIRSAAEARILVKGGGHAMAAGLTIAAERRDDLARFLDCAFASTIGDLEHRDSLSIDGPLSAGGANDGLMALVERAGPYGNGHPEPRFAFPTHRIAFAKTVGSGHAKVSLQAEDGARLEAIAFRCVGTPLGDALLAQGRGALHLAGKLKRDFWQGRESIQLVIDDAAYPR